MEGGRPRKSEVGDWARRAQSIGEWPGVRFTCLEGLVGMQEWVGGGARVEVPGARLGTGRERFGRGAGEGRKEELFLEAGARVGMRRVCVAGSGGGAMAAREELAVDEGAGSGGGDMRSDAGGDMIAGGRGGGGGDVDVRPETLGEGMAGLGEVDSKGSDSEKLGIGWAGSGVRAVALGVVWPSPSTSRGRASRAGCGGCSFEGGGSTLATWWRKLARRFGSGSHAGGRRQRNTTDATISEMPMRAIVVCVLCCWVSDSWWTSLVDVYCVRAVCRMLWYCHWYLSRL